jgi:hypothetical protein
VRRREIRISRDGTVVVHDPTPGVEPWRVVWAEPGITGCWVLQRLPAQAVGSWSAAFPVDEHHEAIR